MNKIIVSLLFTFILTSCETKQTIDLERKKIKTCSVESLFTGSERSYSFISQPYHVSELSFRIGGPIQKLNVQSGQFFRKGQLIAEVDKRDYIIRNERAKAVYSRAEAEYNRISNLFKKSNIAESNYEKVKADYQQAKANYEEAKNNLSDTQLLAPFDGYIQNVYAERYQDIKPAVSVVSFIDLSKIKIEAYVSEEVAMQFRTDKSKSCEISFNSFPSKVYFPSEIYISQSTTANNISYCLTCIISNNDGALWGGMNGKIKIKSSKNASSVSTLVIPQSSVCHNPCYGSYVWKVTQDNCVIRCPVRTGRLRKNNKIEILGGLNVGETIAVSHLHSLSESEIICVNEQN